MKSLTDDDIIEAFSNIQSENSLWSIGMIVISTILLCLCIFIIIEEIKELHTNKRDIRNNQENSESSRKISKTLIENERKETLPSLPFIIVLLIMALPLGCGGILILKESINSSISFRVEEKYVARADMHTYMNENDKIQLPVTTYNIFITENFDDTSNIEKHSVDKSTYYRASEEFTKAYVAVNNNNNAIISIWNENEYLYNGDYLIIESD